VVVGGTLGTEDTSNAAQPWLARFDETGAMLWDKAVEGDYSACLGTQVALTSSGASLAAVSSCAGPWVRAYDRTGTLLWERAFGRNITALAGLADGGYAVALGTREGAYQAEPASAVLQRFDADHQLVWQAELENCYLFERLLSTSEGLLALAGCSQGYVLNRYVDP
jgi:hypothetical protein